MLDPGGRPVLWRKSSYSSDSANCVEFAPAAHHVSVRDSKDPDGPVLRFAAQSWRDFVATVREGQLDAPTL